MGYPMTYLRVVRRNNLTGDYQHDTQANFNASMVSGDLRRLEMDQRDEWHLQRYAAAAGITEAQAKLMLDAFFDGFA